MQACRKQTVDNRSLEVAVLVELECPMFFSLVANFPLVSEDGEQFRDRRMR